MKYTVKGEAHLEAVVEADSKEDALQKVQAAVDMWDGVEGDYLSFNVYTVNPEDYTVESNEEEE